MEGGLGIPVSGQLIPSPPPRKQTPVISTRSRQTHSNAVNLGVRP